MNHRFAVLVAISTATVVGASVGDTSSAAADPQSTIAVTASVAASCRINAATLEFGPYDPVNTHATTPDDASADITIRCTKGSVGAKIDLDHGLNNGSNTQRQMVHASDKTVLLNYEIFKDKARIEVWGKGDNGTERTGSDMDGTGGDVRVTMYGRIPQAQLQAISGGYSDTLVSTIYF
jgi:spore coat protein U-like protein